MSAGARDRRKERRRAAADRRIGHDMAYWYEFFDLAKVAVPVVAVAAGAWYLWTHVDHEKIGGAAGAVGVILVAWYAVWWIREHSPYGSPSRYRRYIKTSVMHFVGLAGALLMAGAVVLWTSGA